MMRKFLSSNFFNCLNLFLVLGCLSPFMLLTNCFADGPADNQVQSVRPMPPPGIKIDDAVRKELQAGYELLHTKVLELRKLKQPFIDKYLPDVEIFDKAIYIALNEDGFFENRDVDSAKKLIEEGLGRATQLGINKPYWTVVKGDVGATVRGYRSKLDGSVQPYGVAWNAPKQRTDVWCRGRSEKGLELQFIAKQLTSPDPAPVPGVLMVYPLGRYCNANKLAGEVDTLEALQHALGEYKMDPKQVTIRGFSMGGAAAWHLAVHYPDKWFAATPGAGFSETPQFLKVFQSETLTPGAYEQTLWQMYDCDKWALNLKNLPTIAYSGAIDKQKQAADVMVDACLKLPEADRFELSHIVAPDTGHKITPEARVEIEKRLKAIHALELYNEVPKKLWFTTMTLKYNQCHWLTIDGLKQHWQPAEVRARIVIQDKIAHLRIDVSGASELSINFDPDQLPKEVSKVEVVFADLDDRKASITSTFARGSDLGFRAGWALDEQSMRWRMKAPNEEKTGLRKKHNLQGPIDDAYMDSFVFVPPSSAGQNPQIDAWVKAEMDRAVREWHKQMRGDVRIIQADQLKEADIKGNNLVLWGDPKSNPKIAELLKQLPITWSESEVAIGSHKASAESHVPVMIFPNPQAPLRYVVLNSSFTYREYDYLNNARQVPKLPDWAAIDVSTAPDALGRAKSAADFSMNSGKVR
ncbi:MAG: prolyl oligopeptidase family serine peptidase [Pirellulales bacterium]